VAAVLPDLLWLYQMGLVMFWVHDRSASQTATKLLTARTVPLLVRIIGLVDLPELRGVVDDVLSLLRDARTIRPDASRERRRAGAEAPTPSSGT